MSCNLLFFPLLTGGCSSLYTDSRSYIQVIFQSFSYEATIYQYQYYYRQFNAVITVLVLQYVTHNVDLDRELNTACWDPLGL